MGEYVGLMAGALTLIAIAVLRLRYGRLSSVQSQREELATYLVLLFFVAGFSLTVLRSAAWVERYRGDLAHGVPYQASHPVLSLEAAGRQLSPPAPKSPAGLECATCHAASREALAGLAAGVARDSAQLCQGVECFTAPLQKAAISGDRAMALLPVKSSTGSLWSKLAAGLNLDGGASRAFVKRDGLAREKKAVQERLSAIRGFYQVAWQKEQAALNLKRYADALRQKDAAYAAHHLLLAVRQNVAFQALLIRGDSERGKAAWSLFILHWGCPLFVAAALGARILLRRLYPGASWYIFPGTILFWAVSLLLMTDLGLRYVPKLRYIGYYTWSRLAFCFSLLIATALLCRIPATRHRLALLLERVRCGSTRKSVMIIFLVLSTGLAGHMLPALVNISSELIKGLAVLFLAWYAMVRGDYISRRTQLKGALPDGWVGKTMTELFLVSLAVLAAFANIHDFGPMLTVIVLFSCYVWVLMGGRALLNLLLIWSGLLGLGWVSRGLWSKTSTFGHIYRRVIEMASPFQEGSTELAKLAWLRRSAGAFGYGFGKIPYSGHYLPEGGDAIVTPLQVQSDYTASHLIAQYGYLPGLALLGIYLLWLTRLLLDASALAGDGSQQAVGRFVGWTLSLAILLMIIQTFLTVGGNAMLLPLSGLTLPYLSFGGASLVFTTLISALSYAKESLQ